MAALRHAVGYLRRARRPSTSFASSPTASFVPRSSAQGVRLPIVVGVAALTDGTQGTVRLSRIATEVNEVQKTELYAAVLSFMLH